MNSRSWCIACGSRALVLLSLCFFLVPNVHGQESGPSGFQFTKVDLQVLDEVNEFDRQMEKRGLVFHNPELDAYLDSLGKRVIGSRPIPENVVYRFKVLRDPMVNAFALPNGTIYINTGLLALLENEAELASILGHETSHVYDRHTYLNNRSVRKKTLAINIVQGVASVVPGGGGGLSVGVQAFCVSVQLGALISSDVLIASIYGYSREMERQADSDGLVSMVSANYDPNAMARSFELMDQDQKLEFEPIQGFYHDHPKLTERRSTALEFASSHALKDPLPGLEKDYLKNVAPAIVANIQSDLNSRRARTAIARAARLTNAMPEEPKYQVLLADAYRTLGAKAELPSEEELSHHGQAEDRKNYFKMTEEEEQKRLKEKPGGEVILRGNRDLAEKLYLSVIEHHPDSAEAHRGLGFLYEQQEKYADAAKEYRRYVEQAAATSIDRVRMERRLAAVEKLAGLQPSQPQ